MRYDLSSFGGSSCRDQEKRQKLQGLQLGQTNHQEQPSISSANAYSKCTHHIDEGIIHLLVYFMLSNTHTHTSRIWDMVKAINTTQTMMGPLNKHIFLKNCNLNDFLNKPSLFLSHFFYFCYALTDGINSSCPNFQLFVLADD